MNLSDWVKQNLPHISLERSLTYNGQTITISSINLELCFGLLSTNDKKEFSKLCFNLAPLGTIIDELDDDFYEGKILLMRNYLTKRMLTDKNYKKYLDILERRSKNEWQKDTGKSVEIKKDKEDNVISINITGV